MEAAILVIALILLVEASLVLVMVARKNQRMPKTGRRKIYVDTSSLIDGRIVEVAKTGFLSDDLLIPRSVIRELQLLADGKDAEKRILARRGMDNASELERVVYCNTTIVGDALDRTPVDELLISLAKENHGLICTNDYNLNKVAATEHIDVLNINDLAMAVMQNLNAGDLIEVKITEKGDKRNQGKGHLENGTLVVVDGASKDSGKSVKAEVLRLYQTSSGLIVFAKKR